MLKLLDLFLAMNSTPEFYAKWVRLKERTPLFVGALFFTMIFLMPHPDLWRRQIWCGLLVSSAAWCLWLAFERRMVLPAAALMYFFWSQIRIFGWFPQYEDWSIQNSAQSFATLLCVTLLIGLPSRKQHEMFLETLTTIAFGTSIWLIAMRFFTPRPYAWLNNPSADASLLAVLYPMLMLRESWIDRLKAPFRPWVSPIAGILPLVAIACCSSTTAVVAAILAIAAMVLRYRKDAGMLIAGAFLALIPLASIPFFTKDHFLNDNGRKEVWVAMIRWWWERVPTHWVGDGGGTFFYTGSAVQQAMGYPNGSIFGFLHNEYLQTIFEQGWIGLALLLLVGVWTLKKSFDRPWLFASLLTYGFVMVPQFPFRFFASALIGALLVREAYETRET